MKTKFLLLALTVVALSSCTTSYKTGQTPDDVYYSPARPQDEYVRTDDKIDDRQYKNDDEYYDDRYLHMKVHDRVLWSDLDDWYYFGNRYNYTSYNNCYNNNPWTPYSYWNSHFNPYYHNNIIINPKTSVVYTSPRTFNLNTYNSNSLTTSNYTNPKNTGGSNNNNNQIYSAPRNNTNTNTRSNSGNILRDIFRSNTTSTPSSNPGNSSGSNTNSNSSSSSTTTPSSSGSSAPVRRF